MPTGYTASVQSGETTEFAEYAINCARAMGACIMQRDDPYDAPIKLDEPSSYYTESLEKARTRLEELENLTEDQKREQFRAFRDKGVENARQGIENRKAEEQRYRDMLEKVEEWTPPSEDHVNFKTFMAEQLTGSIDFDCGTEYYDEQILKLSCLSVQGWYEDSLESARRDIEYHTQHLAEEIERCEGRNRWKLQLFESVGRELV